VGKPKTATKTSGRRCPNGQSAAGPSHRQNAGRAPRTTAFWARAPGHRPTPGPVQPIGDARLAHVKATSAQRILGWKSRGRAGPADGQQIHIFQGKCRRTRHRREEAESGANALGLEQTNRNFPGRRWPGLRGFGSPFGRPQKMHHRRFAGPPTRKRRSRRGYLSSSRSSAPSHCSLRALLADERSPVDRDARFRVWRQGRVGID